MLIKSPQITRSDCISCYSSKKLKWNLLSVSSVFNKFFFPFCTNRRIWCNIFWSNKNVKILKKKNIKIINVLLNNTEKSFWLITKKFSFLNFFVVFVVFWIFLKNRFKREKKFSYFKTFVLLQNRKLNFFPFLYFVEVFRRIFLHIILTSRLMLILSTIRRSNRKRNLVRKFKCRHSFRTS